MYPLAGFTKGDVADYYRRIAPFLLPHLKDHAVTLKRYPDDAGGQFFYEKDAPAFTPSWVRRFSVWRRSGESQIHYIVIDNLRTLLWCASVGTLEVHPFLARVPDIEGPVSIVFDLDPGEGADILDCAKVALLLRDVLAGLALQSFAKVSGSKGLQVYVPLNTSVSYAATQPFARTVAELLEREHPKLVVSEMEKAHRKCRVFIDWSQNADYKTTVAVYSLRAKRRHPYVSLPVSWDELQGGLRHRDARRLFWMPAAAIERVTSVGDLFAPVLSLRQQLPGAFVRSLRLTTSAHLASVRARREAQPSASAVVHASAQGGRRRFILRPSDDSGAKHSGGLPPSVARLRRQQSSGIELAIELHDLTRSFQLPDGIPQRTGDSCPATPLQSDLDVARLIDSDSASLLDLGACEVVEGNYRKNYLDLFFSGKKLKGDFTLSRSPGADRWALSKAKTTPAEALFPWWRAAGFAISSLVNSQVAASDELRPPAAQTSSRGKRSEVTRPAPPPSPLRFIKPMECKLVRHLPDTPQWLYELKLDGYRAIALLHDDTAELYSRYGNTFRARFPQIVDALRNSSLSSVILDGELVALDSAGHPSFQELQNSRTSDAPIVYYVFDVLHHDGRDLQSEPLTARRNVLQRVARSFVEPVRLAAALDTDLPTLLAAVRQQGLEGIVAKRRDSHYESGKRSGAWVKYRIDEREEFLIGGYLPGSNYLDAVLVGRMQARRLVFVKKLRNGFTPQTRAEVFRALQPLRVAQSPFTNLPEPAGRRGAVDAEQFRKCVWVKPELRCEVEFEEWTRGGRLRHAAFRQLVV